MQPRIFPNLSYEAFVSPTDQAALAALRKVPVIASILSWIQSNSFDRLYYTQTVERSIRCSESQFPTLHGMLVRACATLDMPVPELYVQNDVDLNAFTTGIERPYIVLNSGLLDGLANNEILFVIGHELGHIKCGHGLYTMMAWLFVPLLEMATRSLPIPGTQLAGTAAAHAIFEWQRQAEISCDRAGMLVCQDYHTALSSLMRLGGGSSRFRGEMSVDAFLAQARAHEEAEFKDTMAKIAMFVLANRFMEHPPVLQRAKLLDAWIRGNEYSSILNGAYKTES